MPPRARAVAPAQLCVAVLESGYAHGCDCDMHLFLSEREVRRYLNRQYVEPYRADIAGGQEDEDDDEGVDWSVLGGGDEPEPPPRRLPSAGDPLEYWIYWALRHGDHAHRAQLGWGVRKVVVWDVAGGRRTTYCA